MRGHVLAFLLAQALLANSGSALPGNVKVSRSQPASDSRQSLFGETGPLELGLRAELERGLQRLQLPGLPKPYYIASTLFDAERIEVTATLGALGRQQRSQSRTLDVVVRVGDYRFDNSGFIDTDRAQPAVVAVPIDADSLELRRAAWLGIDAAFKQAAAEYEGKRAARSTRAEAQTPEVPSFSKMTPQHFENKQFFELGVTERYASLAKKLSRVFRQYPLIQGSGVSVSAVTARRLLVTTEGTEVVEPQRRVSLVAWATTQAEDGMWLAHHYSEGAGALSELPGEEELEDSLRRLARGLVRLREAPVVENYTGPLLFEGVAAGQLLERLLRDQLSGTPAPEMPGGFRPQPSSWSSRFGLRVFSGGFSLVDDPGMTRFGDQTLVSGYRFDEEGVPAERVQLVENGTLKKLLMSRTPSKEMSSSNGHAARHHFTMVGRPSTLILSTNRGLSRQRLRARLLQRIQEEQLPHGFIIRQLQEPVAGMLAASMGIQSGAGRTSEGVGFPISMFKVLPNGREELVRGGSIEGLTVDDLGDILAATHSLSVHRSVAPTWGETLATPHPPSFVTPDLLIQKADVRRPSRPHPKPPVMRSPAGGGQRSDR